MSALKPSLKAVGRLFLLIVLPILFVKYFNQYFSYLGVSLREYSLPIILTGVIYIAFRFLEEYHKNPKYKMVFSGIALTMLLVWTYYLLNRGVFTINLKSAGVTVYYYPLLMIFIILILLRYPESFMRYYLELRKYDQRKKPQNSGLKS